MKLEVGYNHDFEIRKKRIKTSCADDFSILFLSDLHLNKFCASLVQKIIAVIHKLNPTIILFGGDYVDTRKGLILFGQLLLAIESKSNIFVIAGNHDHYFGVKKLQKVMPKGIQWLGKKSSNIIIGQTLIQIDGNIIKNRSECDFAILLLHIPQSLEYFEDDYDVAFAGHLHGSQFVFWETNKKLYPGKLFYKWNILEKEQGRCLYLISKGLGDTLPIRFNCKRDMLFVEVISAENK